MKRHVAMTLALLLCSILFTLNAPAAVDPPHYNTAAGTTCGTCHTVHQTLGSTGYNNICQSCHRPGDPAAGHKPITPADAANPFGIHSTTGISRMYQTSHRWDGSDTNPAVGAQPPVQWQMTTNGLRTRTGGQLACVRCHNQHSNANGNFLRIANDQDQLCLDCHRSRNAPSHTKGNHPVNINYASKAAANPGRFNARPINANPANPSSNLFARLSSAGGTLLCSTCHSVHYADSRSSTPDGNAHFANLSTGDGYILRTDRRGSSAGAGFDSSVQICSSCHAGKTSHNLKGQDVQCADCHGAHVDYDPNDPTGSNGVNMYLIKRNVPKGTSGSGKVFFRYTATGREYKNVQSTGVCQGCHAVPAPGGIYPGEHAATDPKVCNTCHYHNSSNGSFSGACSACHGYPPTTTTLGGPTGMASPATGATATNPGAHITHAKTNFMACITCHTGYTAKLMPSNSIDIGFAINRSTVPGFGGSVSGGTFNSTPLNNGYSWSAANGTTLTTGNNAITCSVYCHGPTLTGGSATTPAWTQTDGGQKACGSCHGVTSATAPITAGHLRHAGSGAAGRLALACSQCHGSITDNSHVNGNVAWDLSLFGAAAQYKSATGIFATAGSTGNIAPSAIYGQCANVYCHSTVQGAGGSGAPAAYSQPTWGGAALTCGSCHKDMATDAAATGSHMKHIQTLGFACALCHNGLGHDAANHADGIINLAFSGSAGGSSYSKGTFFAPGSGYGSCTTSCHLLTPATWGTTLPTDCTGCHGGNASSRLVLASGMHNKHLNQSPALSSNIPCAACHSSTVSLANDRTISTPSNHGNGTKDVVFSQGGVYAFGLCSNTYCHGTTLPASNPARTAPSWDTAFPTGASILGDGIAGGSNPGSGYCAQCHGYPPQTGHATSGCSTCHAHVNPDNLTFNNPVLHLNGVVDISGGCNVCHGYPPVKAGFVGTHANWSGARSENYPGGGGAHAVQNHVSKLAKPGDGFSNCTMCHNAADHIMTPLAFMPSKNIKVSVSQSFRLESAKQAKYSSNRLEASAHQTGTCSNISCHFGATPKWDPAQ